MNKNIVVLILILLISAGIVSFRQSADNEQYKVLYYTSQQNLKKALNELTISINAADFKSEADIAQIKKNINSSRKALKASDFWTRYLEPIAYKKINGPLPVEWETEVFEKFEPPYKREGAGLTLAELYLDEDAFTKDSLIQLIKLSTEATDPYFADSITSLVNNFDHFYYCNRLYLLNLAAIYTTGFECPDPEMIIPELKTMMADVHDIYLAFNTTFPKQALSQEYLGLYKKAIDFISQQNQDFEQFDHFSFIKDYINPLYQINQQLILQHRPRSKNTMDFSLNKSAKNIFDKALYTGQNTKGIYFNVMDPQALVDIDKLGKMLFYDPILSGNNERSCASCHNPKTYFTDTTQKTAFAFNHKSFLARNTPTLINASYNHLIMQDGQHISLQDQTKGVVINPLEMGANEKDVLEKVLSCNDYKKSLEKLLQHTPAQKEISFEHISSAVTFYYSKFSNAYSALDRAMNKEQSLSSEAIRGFNLFMSKAQCGTCHFVPLFNGVKPPYVGSEFEVLGTPSTPDYTQLSDDNGRHNINPATETMHAFRTGGLRNIMHTAPFMHNGVFNTIEEVIDFYNFGGGAGRGLNVPNQTLSADSLNLTSQDKSDLIAFLKTLDEAVPFEEAPKLLPKSKKQELNSRIVGGSY